MLISAIVAEIRSIPGGALPLPSMIELPAYIQELVCYLAEVTDNDEYIIDVCLRCLEDRNLSDRMLLSLEKGTFVEA